MKIQLTEFVQEIKLGAKKHEFIKKIKKVIYKILNYSLSDNLFIRMFEYFLLEIGRIIGNFASFLYKFFNS